MRFFITQTYILFINKLIQSCSNITKLCETKVRKTLNEFIDKQYVSLGYKKSQARTFYITELGIKVLKQIMPAEEF